MLFPLRAQRIISPPSDTPYLYVPYVSELNQIIEGHQVSIHCSANYGQKCIKKIFLKAHQNWRAFIFPGLFVVSYSITRQMFQILMFFTPSCFRLSDIDTATSFDDKYPSSSEPIDSKLLLLKYSILFFYQKKQIIIFLPCPYPVSSWHPTIECYFLCPQHVLKAKRNIVLPFPQHLLISWKGNQPFTIYFTHIPLSLTYFSIRTSVNSSSMLFSMLKISFILCIPWPKVLPLSLHLSLDPVPRVFLTVGPFHTSVSVEQPIKKITLIYVSLTIFVSSLALLFSTYKHAFIVRSVIPNLLPQPPRQIIFPFTFILISFFFAFKYSQPISRVVLYLTLEVCIVIEDVSSVSLNLPINKSSIKNRFISYVNSSYSMWYTIFPFSHVNNHRGINQFGRIQFTPIITLVQLESWPFRQHFQNIG